MKMTTDTCPLRFKLKQSFPGVEYSPVHKFYEYLTGNYPKIFIGKSAMNQTQTCPVKLNSTAFHERK